MWILCTGNCFLGSWFGGPGQKLLQTMSGLTLCNGLCLKAVDTIGNCQRPVFSLGVFQHLCIKQQTCENLYSIGCRSCEIIMKEKTLLSHEGVCMLSDA